MFQVTQSPFLQALGYAIINSLWQVALLWLLFVIFTSIGKSSSHKKYVTGIVFQLAGFTWFIGTFIFYYNQCLELSNEARGYTGGLFSILPASGATTIKEKLFSFLIMAEQFLPYLSIAYLLLLVFLSLKWLQAYNLTQSLRKNNLLKIDVNLRLFVQNLSEQLGIKRSVKIFLSDVVKSPLTIGFFKPVILMPLAAITNLSTHQLEALILHELAHIKRHDYLINLISSVIEALLFFNPFMQLISKSIRRERENSCDDWVLQFEYNAATYARALLQLATFSSTSNSFAMNATDNKKALLHRVKRMIEKKEKSSNYQYQLIALFFLTATMCLLSWTSPSNKLSGTDDKKVQQIIVEPMAAKVDNPLFNPIFFLADKHQDKIVENLKNAEKQPDKTYVSFGNIHPAKIEKIKTKLRDIANVEPVAINLFPVENVSLPARFASIDTLLFKNNINEIFSGAVEKNLAKAEKEITKLSSVQITKTEQGKIVLLNSVKVLDEIQKALLQIRTTKLATTKDKAIADIMESKAKRENQSTAYLKLAQEKRNELEHLLQAAEDKENAAYEITLRQLEKLNANLPPKVYTVTYEKPYTFSYDYQEERPLAPTSRVTKVAGGSTEAPLKAVDTIRLSTSSPAAKSIKVKILKTIKI